MATCKHPMTERGWIDNKLTCALCGYVLKEREAPVEAEDLFSEKPEEESAPCSESSVCKNVNAECSEDFCIDSDNSCFEPIDIPGNESSEEDPFGEQEVVEEVVEEATGFAAETVSASSEGLTKGEEFSEAFMRPLNIMVTPIQLGEFSLEQATLYRELKELEESKKASAASYKSRIDRVELRLDELAKVVMDGTIETPIECQWQFHYEHGIKKLVRLDTHEVVDEKTLTAEELQGSFDFQAEVSVEAVEDAFKTTLTESSLLPGQCPECLFKRGKHSPVCSLGKAEVYSLCECNECHAEGTCVPFSDCPDCKDGKMLPSDEPAIAESEDAL